MAKGVGSRPTANASEITFWDLPQEVQDRAEETACHEHGVDDWWKLDPGVRREARDRAVREDQA